MNLKSYETQMVGTSGGRLLEEQGFLRNLV